MLAAGLAQPAPASAVSNVFFGTNQVLGPTFEIHESGADGDVSDARAGFTDGTMGIRAYSGSGLGDPMGFALARLGRSIRFKRRCATQTTSAPLTYRFHADIAGEFEVSRSSSRGEFAQAVGTDDTQRLDVRSLVVNEVGTTPYEESGPISVTTTVQAERDAQPYIEFLAASVSEGSGFADVDFFTAGRGIGGVAIELDWGDVTPPVVAVDVQSAAFAGGWYRSPVSLSVTPSDPEACVQRVSSRLDGEPSKTTVLGFEQGAQMWQNITTSGQHVLTYSATNFPGVETAGALTFNVDAAAPATSGQASCEPNVLGNCRGSATIQLACDDPHSGCDAARMEYRVDGGPWQTGNSLTVTGLGEHAVEYKATDTVGNVSAPASLNVFVDCAGNVPAVAGVCLPL